MMAPVCVPCQAQMRCKETGIDVELMTAAEPYQIWNADLFACERCGASVVTQFGNTPVAEHWQRDRYAAFVKGIALRFWGSQRDKLAAALSGKGQEI